MTALLVFNVLLTACGGCLFGGAPARRRHHDAADGAARKGGRVARARPARAGLG
ncbi:hypothetical protein FTUN_1984 [Frigoriglobus tundricola]|uniref:Uncharacterized protein n=1 Tax=Frigoriglobus tundricola TaxID=2774151 RepID=A0A6M5YLK8_9BACT|nr:hypothetical protein FTUN_1984 [Frigoriglobus tundricola]